MEFVIREEKNMLIDQKWCNVAYVEPIEYSDDVHNYLFTLFTLFDVETKVYRQLNPYPVRQIQQFSFFSSDNPFVCMKGWKDKTTLDGSPLQYNDYIVISENFTDCPITDYRQVISLLSKLKKVFDNVDVVDLYDYTFDNSFRISAYNITEESEKVRQATNVLANMAL